MYEKQGKSYPGNEEVIKDPTIIKAIKDGVEQVNKTLSHYETIKKIELLPQEWSIDKGELTPKV